MGTNNAWHRNGFVLIEALVALLLISVGLLAISKLQVLSVSGVGEARSYSRAMAISQKKLEELRNILFLSQFTGALAPMAPGSEVFAPVAGDGNNATYTLTWQVAPDPTAVAPVPPVEQRVLRLRTTWTDRYGQPKVLDLSSVIAWDDPGARVNSTTNGRLPQLVTPTGEAIRSTNREKRGDDVGITNPDGSSRTYVRDDKTTELLKYDGTVLLELPPSRNAEGVLTAQSFTTISGKVYFDQGEVAQIPEPRHVRLRLSSEGECIFDTAALTTVGGFKYFAYTCYVGRGWYGNVGVVVDAAGTGNPTMCIGDPGFGVSNNTLISPHAAVSATRSYRGFKGSPGAYLSTGVAAGIKFGIGSQPGVAGLPVPSGYAGYGIAPGAVNDYFEQNFLVTRINGQVTGQQCALKMAGGVFARNAGKYVCISPDSDPASDQCPAIWPNFENQVGSGSGVVLTVLVPAGANSGTVSSAPAGISCGATCQASFASGTQIDLTATPALGFAFGGWSGGGCTGTGTCTVALTAATSVTANFNSTGTYALDVNRTGSGTGSVASSPGGINCGGTCTANYNPGTQITLTAAPASGSMFVGWSDPGCLTAAPCTLTLNAAKSVTATFDLAPTYSVTVVKTGSGTVASSPAGIECGATCTAAFAQNADVTLTATPSGTYTFGSWGGACAGQGPGSCVVRVSAAMNVTASFNAPVVNYSVSVTKAGAGASTGLVTSSSGGINCGTTCSGSFAAGTNVVLTASTTSGSFTGWSGGGCSGTGMCTISSIAAATAVTANFGACNTPISGSRFSKFGNVVVAAGNGTCTMENGNAGYNCPLTALAGSQVVLTDSAAAQGNDPAYSYQRTVTATCTPQVINFPRGP